MDCPDIEYAITYESGAPLDKDLFRLTSDRKLYIQSTDPSKVREYTIKIFGQMAFFTEE
jgi:hypothetical protein